MVLHQMGVHITLLDGTHAPIIGALPPHLTVPRQRTWIGSVTRVAGNLDKFFFTLGGSEANENAIKLARLHTVLCSCSLLIMYSCVYAHHDDMSLAHAHWEHFTGTLATWLERASSQLLTLAC